jgi:hypothetical protein
MMKTVWFILLAFISLCTTGCKTNFPPLPPPSLPPAGVELDSAYIADWGASILYYQALEERLKTYTKYSFRKRRRFYPFNRASSVQLAYFDYKDANENRTLPQKNGAIDLEKINVLVHLNSVELDTLTDILYNSRYRLYISSSSKMGCYYPRNAILFSDENGRIFDYIEICFGCHQFRKSREKVYFDSDNFSDYSLELLEQFFSKQGLTTTGDH